MSELIDTANAIASSITGAQVSFVPEFDLSEIETMKIVVVPMGCEVQVAGRSSCEMRLKIWVAILKRVVSMDIESMINYSQGVGASLLGQRFGNATCLSVNYNPVYASDKLRECRQFTSVIEMNCKVICGR